MRRQLSRGYARWKRKLSVPHLLLTNPWDPKQTFGTSRFYGTSKKGKYMSEADAIKEGDRAAAKGQ